MINKLLRLLVVITTMAIAHISWAADGSITVDGFTFDIYETASYGSNDYPNQRGDNVWFSGAVLVNTNGKTGEIKIPSKVNYQGKEYPVVGISGNEDTFYGHSGITKITIPGTVRLCENNSLREMEDLKELVFEDGTEDLWLGYSPGPIVDDELTYGSDNLNKVTIGRDLKWYTDEDEPFEDKHNLRTVVFTKGCKHIGIPGTDDYENRSLFNSCPDIETFIFEDSDDPLYVEYYGLYTKDEWASRHQWKNIYIGRDIHYPGWDEIMGNTADGDGYSPFYKLGNTDAKVTIGEKVTRLGSYMFFDGYMATLDCKAKEISVNDYVLGIGEHSDGAYFNIVVFDQDTYWGGALSNANAKKVIVKPSCSTIITSNRFLKEPNFALSKVDSLVIEASDEEITLNPEGYDTFELKHFLCYRSIGTTSGDYYKLNISEELLFDDKCTKIGGEILSFIGITHTPVVHIGKSVKEMGMINPGLDIHVEPFNLRAPVDWERLIKEYFQNMKVPTIIFDAETNEELPQITAEHLLWDGTNSYCSYKFTGFMEQVPVCLNENIDIEKLDRNKWNFKNLIPTGIEDSEVVHNDITGDNAGGISGIFNINGQRMNKVQKGFNIVNGKKVIFVR